MLLGIPDDIGNTPPYPLYFNPELQLRDGILFVEDLAIEEWACEFVQLDKRAPLLGIFSVRLKDRKIFLAFGGQALPQAYLALLRRDLPNGDIDEAIRKFELIHPVCLGMPFNLQNFYECSHQMARLSKVLMECYDEQYDCLNILNEQESFEKVLRQVIVEYLKVMNPY